MVNNFEVNDYNNTRNSIRLQLLFRIPDSSLDRGTEEHFMRKNVSCPQKYRAMSF